jgi:hypothetical protein
MNNFIHPRCEKCGYHAEYLEFGKMKSSCYSDAEDTCIPGSSVAGEYFKITNHRTGDSVMIVLYMPDSELIQNKKLLHVAKMYFEKCNDEQCGDEQITIECRPLWFIRLRLLITDMELLKLSENGEVGDCDEE